MGALALFLVLTGGVAYAANTVFSSDIVNDQVFSADVRNDTLAGGGLTAGDLRSGAVATAEINDGAVRPADVQDEALTGADIKNQSGVDTCVLGVRFGQLCVKVENLATWPTVFNHCASLGLRLPSISEAMELAKNYDIPNVDEPEPFWTGDRHLDGAMELADRVHDNGGWGFAPTDFQTATVCVTTPTN
jgi:hypothetical protein